MMRFPITDLLTNKGANTPPTILQNRLLSWGRSQVLHPEHDPDRFLADLDPLDQRADQGAAPGPVEMFKTGAHLRAELLQPADHQLQLGLLLGLFPGFDGFGFQGAQAFLERAMLRSWPRSPQGRAGAAGVRRTGRRCRLPAHPAPFLGRRDLPVGLGQMIPG